MELVEKYNKELLVKVKVTPKELTKVKYFPEKRFSGIKIRKGGFYRIDKTFTFYEGETVDSDRYIVEDGVVYLKPYVHMLYASGFGPSKYFDTFEEASNYAKEITNDRKWFLLK